jgi:hypothetical protein
MMIVAVGLWSGCEERPPADPTATTVAETPSRGRATDGRYISWQEHLIDDQATSGGVPLRGADGLEMADLDRDGHLDIVAVHEDSDHFRIAFGSGDPDGWTLVTLAEGPEVDTVEDVAIGDLDGDGWLDLMCACERGHIIYFENPGVGARSEPWSRVIPDGVTGRGSWIRVFVADFDLDGRLEVTAANKGQIDVADPETQALHPTSLFVVDGDPLTASSWRERELITLRVPINARPVDIDRDGDMDVLTGSQVDRQPFLIENLLDEPGGRLDFRRHRLVFELAGGPPPEWSGETSAFNVDVADLDGDGRLDIVLTVGELWQGGGTLGFGWLQQPAAIGDRWTFHRIGGMLPDSPAGLRLADIDGDGDLDLMGGSYSGLDILRGGFSGDPRDRDGDRVTPSSSVGRIAWFANPGDPTGAWQRHDITRRVRGMFDAFWPLDMDGDGDVDFVSTRGNSGEFDGLFWLEQVRSDEPRRAFTPARAIDSRDLPLPPADWMARY